MARTANPSLFRAEALTVNWPAVAAAQQRADVRTAPSIRVTWACHASIGVPHGVFTVWSRLPKGADAKPTQAVPTPYGSRTLLRWAETAGRVIVSGTVSDATRPVAVQLSWGAPTPESIVAASSLTTTGAVRVDLRCAGANCAVVDNITDPRVDVLPLDEIVNAGDWQQVELVGLPVDGALGDYDGAEQGLVQALTDPASAAVDRLRRGAPRLGWFPTLPSGVAAPPWSEPDPDALVTAIRKQLLNRLDALYEPGRPEHDQAAITRPTAVASPGTTVPGDGPDTTIDAAPWPLLAIPSQTDPWYNLALGFGTGYEFGGNDLAFGRVLPEYLVTAEWSSGPVIRVLGVEIPAGPSGEWAAYAPPVVHAATAAPLGLAAVRYSLRGPSALDGPWQENVRLSWPPLSAGAGWGRPTQQSHCGYDAGDAQAVSTAEKDQDYGGWRIPPIPAPGPGGRIAIVDPFADIPLGSGGRHRGYGLAQNDVYGVWSPWVEARYDGSEPGAATPVLASPHLTSSYTGTPAACPTDFSVEMMLEWTRRTTTAVEFTAVFYPMSGPGAAPPAGVAPGAAPAGCHTAAWTVAFSGPGPAGAGCTVVPLDQQGRDRTDPDGDGGSPPVPVVAGPAQGEPRRFRVEAPVPPLDFTGSGRWGAVVWARRSTAVGPSPTGWSPADPARWAITTVGSPVPVTPSITMLPGVPLGSTPDAAGRSHVRVVWGAPAPAPVRNWVIWGTSEANLRDTLGLPPAASPVPGARLLELRTALAVRGADAQRAFRRVLELPELAGSPRDADVALARGATDLQFFVVTSTTPTGADSPFPTTRLDEQAQAFMAPRIVRPSPPLLRTAITASGFDVDLEVASDVPVGAFRLYSTRKFDAARRADSMGAPTLVPAIALVDAGTARTDPRTGSPMYGASAALGTSTGWQPAYLRAVAVPDPSGVPEQALRGLLSAESDIVTVATPPDTGPDLAPLIVSEGTPDHLVLVARTSTSAPDDTAWGVHRIAGAGATLDESELAALPTVPLAEVETIGDGTPAPAILPAPGTAVLVRGPRTAGRTPLAVWFARADAGHPVDVALRIVDPLGRATIQRATAPATAMTAPPTIHVVRSTHPTAASTTVTVAVSASPAAAPAVLSASASATSGPRRILVRGSAPLPSIPPSSTVVVVAGRIVFGWRRLITLPRTLGHTVYDVVIPLATAERVTIVITDGEGRSASVTTP